MYFISLFLGRLSASCCTHWSQLVFSNTCFPFSYSACLFWGWVKWGGGSIQILKVLDLVLGDVASVHNLTYEQHINNSINPWNLLNIFFGNGFQLCCNYCFDSTKLSWVPRLWNSSVILSNFKAVKNHSGQEAFVIAILHGQVDLKNPILFIKWILVRVKPFFFLANYE